MVRAIGTINWRDWVEDYEEPTEHRLKTTPVETEYIEESEEEQETENMAKKKGESSAAIVSFMGRELPLIRVDNVTAMILINGKNMTTHVNSVEPLTDAAREMLGVKKTGKKDAAEE